MNLNECMEISKIKTNKKRQKIFKDMGRSLQGKVSYLKYTDAFVLRCLSANNDNVERQKKEVSPHCRGHAA